MDELKLLEHLEQLTPTQFNRLIFTCRVSKSLLPSEDKPQTDRAIALLDLAQAPGGVGWQKVEEVLKKLIGVSGNEESLLENHQSNQMLHLKQKQRNHLLRTLYNLAAQENSSVTDCYVTHDELLEKSKLSEDIFNSSIGYLKAEKLIKCTHDGYSINPERLKKVEQLIGSKDKEESLLENSQGNACYDHTTEGTLSNCEPVMKKNVVQPTIGIITALPKEYAAVERILKNTKKVYFRGQGAGNQYLRGEVSASNQGTHTIVLCLAASMGNNSAAIRASSLIHHFPDIKSIIMVGIAGGIPSPEQPDDHVRLGDIVISNQQGVIQYDFDKETMTDNIHRHPPRPPSPSLIEGVSLLEADELAGKKPWRKFIGEALLPEGEERPSNETDILVSSTSPDQNVEHPLDPKRKNNEPRVFIAPIASANKLLKNPIKRDQLRDEFAVKAVEMEGSGIADATWTHEIGYLVVRGICDYCDSNKGDKWQAYAAAVAAAYTRALLESMPTTGTSKK
jgi:nucleoside phosphorylase